MMRLASFSNQEPLHRIHRLLVRRHFHLRGIRPPFLRPRRSFRVFPLAWIRSADLRRRSCPTCLRRPMRLIHSQVIRQKMDRRDGMNGGSIHISCSLQESCVHVSLTQLFAPIQQRCVASRLPELATNHVLRHGGDACGCRRQGHVL